MPLSPSSAPQAGRLAGWHCLAGSRRSLGGAQGARCCCGWSALALAKARGWGRQAAARCSDGRAQGFNGLRMLQWVIGARSSPWLGTQAAGAALPVLLLLLCRSSRSSAPCTELPVLLLLLCRHHLLAFIRTVHTAASPAAASPAAFALQASPSRVHPYSAHSCQSCSCQSCCFCSAGHHRLAFIRAVHTAASAERGHAWGRSRRALGRSTLKARCAYNNGCTTKVSCMMETSHDNTATLFMSCSPGL